MSLLNANGIADFGKRWRIRVDKGLSAVQQGFQALEAQVARNAEIRLPMGAHRSFWSGLSDDADLIEFLARALPDNGLFLDVGANIGLYSAGLWKLRGNMRGAAFEPIPTTAYLLRSTFDLNQVPFTVERAALSDGAGVLKLSSYPNGLNNFWIAQDDGTHPTTDVLTMSLDDWCGENPERIPGAIKIDVEGHELSVLRGARRTLRAHRPAMVMECHAASWEDLGVSRREMEAEVRAIGYKRICDRAGRPPDFQGARATFHLLGLP